MNTIETHKDDLIRELSQVLKDAEDLIKNSEQQAGEGFHHAKDKLTTTLKNAKNEIARIEEVVVKKAKESALATDNYVHENPWKTAGIAAGVGLLLGLLIAKNK
jgi:ElaB/YqjD/DUF883 family membrane-anchored ribosome-binding protein